MTSTILVMILTGIGGLLLCTLLFVIVLRVLSSTAINLYFPILHTAIDEAWNIIYSNHIVVWIESRRGVDKAELHKYEQEFVKLVHDQIGIMSRIVFLLLYGTLSPLNMYVILQFRKRIDDNIKGPSET